MTICNIPSAFLDFEVIHLGTHWLKRSTFSKNLHGKVANSHVSNIRRPKNYHPEVIEENKLQTLENFKANPRNLLASVQCGYGDCLS